METNDSKSPHPLTADLAPQQPGAWLDALRSRLQQARQRRLVWVEGTAEDTWRWAAAALPVGFSEEICRVGMEGIRPDQARARLGQEYSVLVWDAYAGFHPDGFGALAGTLAGGGVLLLLTPPAAEWPFFADPDYRRLGATPEERFYLKRLAGVLEADPHVLRIRPNAALPPLPVVATAFTQSLPTDDQQRAFEAILRVRRGHRRRPLVLTADRGRGKSAILGVAAAHLINQEALSIVVTALQPRALKAFWRHAEASLDNPEVTPGALFQGQAVSGSRGSIRYLAPADLLAELPAADLLIVDEAAMIPVPLLTQILDRYARVVFATTVHGYEGSGRGFSIRFQGYLNDHAPQWQALTLAEPVRWSASDPLEPLLNRMLLLDADLPGIEPEPSATFPKQGCAPARGGDIELVPWPRPARTADEARLAQVFGLLVNAHYQTTPDDLRLLLDDEDAQCWLALQDETVVGALWLVAEGGLDMALATAVRRGERRTRGQLLPQALAAYGGDAHGATLRYWRVVRIAVHPAARRQGIGAALLARAQAEAARAGIDVLGTSFGSDQALFCFWRRCGFAPLRMGLRRDAASGGHSLMMGLAVTKAGRALCQRQAGRFAEHWPLLLTTELACLEPDLVWLLSRHWYPAPAWSEQDQVEVGDFARGYRPLALTLLPLQRLTWWWVGAMSEPPAVEGGKLWCRAVLQQLSEQQWQDLGLAEGRKAGLAQLRSTAASLLALRGDTSWD